MLQSADFFCNGKSYSLLYVFTKNRNKYVELYLALDETSICALDHIYLLISVSWRRTSVMLLFLRTNVIRCIETITISSFMVLWRDRITIFSPNDFFLICTQSFIEFAVRFQIFEGNSHYDTPEVRRFEELVAQYIRVFPERWSPAGIGMRVEVLGCELPGKTTGGPQRPAQLLIKSAVLVYNVECIVCVFVYLSSLSVVVNHVAVCLDRD